MKKQKSNSYKVRAYAAGKYSRTSATKMDKNLLHAIAKCDAYFGTWMKITGYRITRPDGSRFTIYADEMKLLRGL